MRLSLNSYSYSKPLSFNMTPIIDIVFLLIIFFLVVCQFIEAENFPVEVPEKCNLAQDHTSQKVSRNIVTVMKTTDGETNFAVGSERILAQEPLVLVEEMTKRIDDRLKNLPPFQRVVILRIDKNIAFVQAQYALAAVAKSLATEIQLAAIKNESDGSY